MGNLASTQLSTQSDPALVQRQILADREKQLASIANPQQQLAARLGGLLGGGLVNLAQDRGFFDVNDPLLNRVSQIQGIYNEVASRVDPTANPAQFYSELQAAYTNAGLGREALAAAQEAQKAKGTGIELQLKETQLLEKNPELIVGRIEQALKSGDEAEAMRLANLKTRIEETRGLEIEKTKADIDRIKAQTREAQDRIESGKYDWKIITNAYNAPIGVQTINKRTGAVEFKEIDPEIAKKFLQFGENKPTDGTKAGDKKEKAPLSQGFRGDTPAATAAPTNQPTTWSGVPMTAKPVTPLTAIQERDFAIQRAYPTLVVSTLPEEAKAQLAIQLGL